MMMMQQNAEELQVYDSDSIYDELINLQKCNKHLEILYTISFYQRQHNKQFLPVNLIHQNTDKQTKGSNEEFLKKDNTQWPPKSEAPRVMENK